MALNVRLSICSKTGEHSLGAEFLEVVNRGTPPDYLPGAVDLRRYEVHLRNGDRILRTATVDHVHSRGAWCLARLALDALDDRERPMGALDEVLASAGLAVHSVTLAVRPWVEVDMLALRRVEAALETMLGVPTQLIAVPSA